jgi:iron complex transport system substrate-binding protein
MVTRLMPPPVSDASRLRHPPRGRVCLGAALRQTFACLWLLCALSAQAVTLTDDLGRRVTLAQPPQRIVALGPAIVEGLCALQACERLVGVDRFSNFPPQVKKLPQLGGLGETSVEQVLSLKPDLVLLTPAHRLHDRLQQLGVPVLALDAQTLPEVRRLLQQLARVLGESARADALWAQIDAELAQAAQGVDPRWRGVSVYFEVDPSPYAAGEASFVGALLARLGLRNVVPAPLGTFPKLNPEFVLRAAPQLVMAGRRDAPLLAQRPGWAALPALKAQRVCALSAEGNEVVGRPGPRVAEALRVLRDCLQQLTPP